MSSPLSPDQWQQLESLVDALLDTPPERRAALFARVSGGDPVRQAELEQLVAACERAYPLLDQTAAERFAALVDTSPLQPGQVVAERYRIARELARGGMATVYLAHDLKHARDVALKVVRSELVATVGSGRFLREIEIAAQLRHPNIVPLYDSGRAPAEESGAGEEHSRDGMLYYVMPYEAGQSLRERLRRDGPLSIDDTLVILHDVCDALAYAHRRGIVHRDIKPDNVLMSGRHALVTDFGVARAATEADGVATTTGAGVMLGTPAYMAPEQVAADPRVDHRVDVYALGVLAYELLTGRPPFGGDSPQDILAAHLTQAPAPLATIRADVPNELADAVMRCLAKKPADRWQSADELLHALDAARGSDAVVTPRPTVPASPVAPSGTATLLEQSAARPFARAMSRRSLGVATLVVVLAGIATLGLPPFGRDRRATASASGSRLAIGILPVRAVSPTKDLDWLASGLESQLSVELAEVSGLEVRPTETIDALMRMGWPLDSVALAREVDFFVRTVLSKGGTDSVVVTMELIERGIRSVRAGVVRVPLQLGTTVEGLGRRLAERLRPMLGSRAREQELERGSTNALALQRRRRADHYRLIARERMVAEDHQGAERSLDSANALLLESERLDPNWAAPRLARASLGASRALVALQKSRGADVTSVRRAFDSGLGLLDSVLMRTPTDAVALALRGRLRWQRTSLSGLAPLEAKRANELAERDLQAALAIDTTLARAAADLSEIYFVAHGRYDEAVAYGERADRIDSYMEESSQIVNRLALGNLELNRDADAERWCREGLRRFPANPAHTACMLEVLAWGTGPAHADSAWAYYRELERLTAPSNVAARVFYTVEVAAVLARSGAVPHDSVRAMLARVRAEGPTNPDASPVLRDELRAREAAVLYRLGDSTGASELIAQVRRNDPPRAGLLAQRRMLRDYVRSIPAPNDR